MNVLYVVTAAAFSGPSRHVLWLAEHLIAQGHRVGIVCAPEPRIVKEAGRLGAMVYTNPYFVRPVRPLTDLRALEVVIRSVRDFGPDLVSAHSTKAGLAARVACWIVGIPVIFTAHGWAFTEGRPAWSQVMIGVENLAAKVTRRIICVSEHDRQLALRFGVAPPEKVVTIRNGVRFESLIVSPRSVPLTDCSGKVITMVGRLVPQKDPMTLLRACQLLKEDFRLVIVGNGELRGDMEYFVRKNGLSSKVYFTGEREDIPEILAASNVFVLSSRWEGLSRAIIEAMMFGLPVVATDVGGTAELVEDGITGFLVPAQDPAALAQALDQLLKDEMLRNSMGSVGRERALERFSLPRMLMETQTVYEEILNGQASKLHQFSKEQKREETVSPR